MEPIAAARASLLGLAVGDAFGSMLDGFGADLARKAAKRLISTQRPWRWTDDTAMALSIVMLLEQRGTLDPDALAAAFVRRFQHEPDRGYGAGAYGLLSRVSLGASWREEATGMFRGTGSFGNGAAMRAAPIGAFFAPDLERVRSEALRSAEPTHAHPDGAAGAVAVAIAAAIAQTGVVLRDAMLAEVARWTPPSLTRDKLLRAEQLGLAFDIQLAGEELGTGANVTSQDTVPFAIWLAARHLDSYEEALWAATAHPGLDLAPNAFSIFAIDRDTLGAIVGGIVACATGVEAIPVLWRAACEPLPELMPSSRSNVQSAEIGSATTSLLARTPSAPTRTGQPMGWTPDEAEVARVCALDVDARYALMVNKVREHGELWTLASAEGWVFNRTEDDSPAIPVWPHERFAELEATEAWADARPERISLADWLGDSRASWFADNDTVLTVFLAGASSMCVDYGKFADEIRGPRRGRYPRKLSGSGVARAPKRATRTTHDLVSYLARPEIELVMRRVPKELCAHIGDILLRRSSDAKYLGSASPGGTGDIIIASRLPVRVSLGRYAYPGQSPEEFGAPRLGQWPPWAVRRFLLYDVLLHEIGHLQIVGPKAAWVTARNSASETRAREFADELRRILYSEPFDHSDPIHNAPTAAELSTLTVWERLDKTQRAQLVNLVLAAPDGDARRLSGFGALTAEQYAFLSRLLTAKRE